MCSINARDMIEQSLVFFLVAQTEAGIISLRRTISDFSELTKRPLCSRNFFFYYEKNDLDFLTD